MTKYTPEHIAQRRAEMQADERHDSDAQCTPDEFYELLDEIEWLNSMVKRLVEAGNVVVGDLGEWDIVVHEFQDMAKWNKLVAAWKAQS